MFWQSNLRDTCYDWEELPKAKITIVFCATVLWAETREARRPTSTQSFSFRVWCGSCCSPQNTLTEQTHRCESCCDCGNVFPPNKQTHTQTHTHTHLLLEAQPHTPPPRGTAPHTSSWRHSTTHLLLEAQPHTPPHTSS